MLRCLPTPPVDAPLYKRFRAKISFCLRINHTSHKQTGSFPLHAGKPNGDEYLGAVSPPETPNIVTTSDALRKLSLPLHSYGSFICAAFLWRCSGHCTRIGLFGAGRVSGIKAQASAAPSVATAVNPRKAIGLENRSLKYPA